MLRKKYFLIILTMIILLISAIIIFSINDESTANKVDIIANNTSQDNGSVQVIRNIGNPNSKKIAYVVGVHPLENDTHRTLLEILPDLTDLNYCYDIYIINVTQDFRGYGNLLPDDEPGRDTGQKLALKYVYPEIMNGSYDLVVDVHGHGAYYPVDTFIFTPVDNELTLNYAHNVSNSTENISYYDPEQTTSGPYLTIPLNENGVASFYFEENIFLPKDMKDLHMVELIRAVDNLKL